MKQVLMVLSIMVVGLAAFSLVGDAQAAEVTPLYPGNGGNGGNGRGPAAGADATPASLSPTGRAPCRTAKSSGRLSTL